MADERWPRKAYYVERVFRCVVLSLVYADNAEDARRRDAMDGFALDTQYEPRGHGKVRRAPEEDRRGRRR